ncbi:hypothetical protein SF123566_8399 [Shigella flexneri 1235-66]|nr:hypothetical protein SF123566_8399 [Shigella flexneri 1235-66]
MCVYFYHLNRRLIFCTVVAKFTVSQITVMAFFKQYQKIKLG